MNIKLLTQKPNQDNKRNLIGKSFSTLLVFYLMVTQLLMGQSLFNRFTGSDMFNGSASSSAMGRTHLLNSSGSWQSRYNPASLAKGVAVIDLQLSRMNVFERRSMPVRDSFDEFLTHADYVANTYNTNFIHAGVTYKKFIRGLGNIGVGISLSPMTHFNYDYSEEVRGSYRTEYGEYAGKDPVVGFQNLKTKGMLSMISIGTGCSMQTLLHFNGNVGLSLNQILESEFTEIVQVDSLYKDVTNLSTYPDVVQSAKTQSAKFLTVSAEFFLLSYIQLAASYESPVTIKSNSFHWGKDSANGFFQIWNDSNNYAPSGINFTKPAKSTLGISYTGGGDNNISIYLENDFLQYDTHQDLRNTKNVKFGFQYLTHRGTPVRGGLVYKGSPLQGMNPISIFTFGTGKSINNIQIDFGGNYGILSYNHPDLFPVSGDIRPDYDLVRESQLQLHLSVQYLW